MGMPDAQCLGFAAPCEVFFGVLADVLRQPVARPCRGVRRLPASGQPNLDQIHARIAVDRITAHWYGKWKTTEVCMGLFNERQQARHEWIANRPRRRPEEAHATAVVTYDASPVRSLTAKVCLACLWISRHLDEGHPEDSR